MQGYQTGYRYRGLSLLQAEGDSGRPAAWDEVVEGGEGDRLHRRRGELCIHLRSFEDRVFLQE